MVEPDPTDPPSTRRSHRRWLFVGVPAVVALAVVAAIALNAGHHSGRTSTAAGPPNAGTAVTGSASTPPASAAAGSSAAANGAVPAVQPRAAMLAWVGNNLSHSAVVVGDSDAVKSLQLSGFSSAVSFANLKGIDLQTVDYVLDVPDQPDPTPAQRQLLASSLPVAIFGSGNAAVSARQVFPAGISALAARRAQDDDIRRRGGLELTQNPSVRMSGQIAGQLGAGQLDLRALNVLNTLATVRPVWLAQILTDANEQRAGLPPRSIVITTEDPQDVQNMLASMPAPYKPDTLLEISQTKFRLTWKPAIAPVAALGN